VPSQPNKPRTLLVVPCYNEADRLDGKAILGFLAKHADVGLIFVNDGSSDGTLEALSRIEQGCPDRVVVIDQSPNRGKAEAVRVGMLAALDREPVSAGYWDADLATPLEEVLAFQALLEQKPELDFILGARLALLGRRIERKALRHYLGRVFATGASITLNLRVYDTQCGAKLLRVRPYTRSLFVQRFGSRWIFDVELIARYLLLSGNGGSGIYEHVLSSWTDVAESKVKPVDFVRAIGEMFRIYRSYELEQPRRRPILLLTSVFSIYALVGALGTALHFLTLIIAVEVFSLPKVVAASAGAALGAVTNYVINYHMTFASRLKHSKTFPKFAAVALLAIGVSGAGARLANHLGIHYLVAQLACTLTVLALGFLLNRFWTFAE
jgi:dolichyl-phosphate beta-glucosyltransferase